MGWVLTMSPREISHALRRTPKTYTVTVVNGCSLHPDLTLHTTNRSHAERRHARYLSKGYPSRLTVAIGAGSERVEATYAD
jgi:hypothetical protein